MEYHLASNRCTNFNLWKSETERERERHSQMERKRGRKHAAHTKVVEIDVWDWKYSSGRAISEVKKISVLHLACDTISIEKHNEYRVLLLHLLCQKGSIMLYYDTYTKQHTLYQGSPTPRPL